MVINTPAEPAPAPAGRDVQQHGQRSAQHVLDDALGRVQQAAWGIELNNQRQGPLLGRLIDILVNEVTHRRIDRGVDNNPVDVSVLTVGGHTQKQAQTRQETGDRKEADKSNCTVTISHARDVLFLGVRL